MKKYIFLSMAFLTQTMAMEELPLSHGVPSAQGQSQPLPSIQEIIREINEPCMMIAHQFFYQRFKEISQLDIPESIRDDLYNFNALCLNGYINGTLLTLCQAISPYNEYYYYPFFYQLYNTYANLYPLTPISLYPVLNTSALQDDAAMSVDGAVAEPVEFEERESFFSQAQLDYIRNYPELTPEAIYNAFGRGKKKGLGFTAAQKRLGNSDKRLIAIQSKILELRR